MKRTYWIVERTPGNAFTTVPMLVRGEEVNTIRDIRVPIKHTRFGPFGSIPAAENWISCHGRLHASYEIEVEVELP